MTKHRTYALTDKKLRPPKPPKPGVLKRTVYSDAQKMEAIQMYLALGSINGVSKLINIPTATLFLWKSTKWWQELVRQFKTQENLVLSNKLKTVLDKSIEIVTERLEHGDYLYDQKTGEIRRKPVLMKDALKVATEFIDKRQKIERPEYEQVAQEGVMERLEKLAKSFEEIAIRKNSDEKPIVIEVTDVVFTKETKDAVPEGREA